MLRSWNCNLKRGLELGAAQPPSGTRHLATSSTMGTFNLASLKILNINLCRWSRLGIHVVAVAHHLKKKNPRLRTHWRHLLCIKNGDRKSSPWWGNRVASSWRRGISIQEDCLEGFFQETEIHTFVPSCLGLGERQTDRSSIVDHRDHRYGTFYTHHHKSWSFRSSKWSASRPTITGYWLRQALRPTSMKIRDLPAGFLIPVAILIVISFPPLFGHELIALLCGVVYGLWIGFAIVAAGTFLGEGRLSNRCAQGKS